MFTDWTTTDPHYFYWRGALYGVVVATLFWRVLVPWIWRRATRGQPTKALRFEGYGDDAFMERTHKAHFDNAASGKPIVFEVKALDGSGLRVWGQYGAADEPEGVGAWMIGVQPLDEFVPIPPWPMRWDGMTKDGESAVLVIDAPLGVSVRCLNKRSER